MFKKLKSPTDLKILEYIYTNYYQDFERFDKSNPQRDSKIYVPIDCKKIAENFGVDGDIIFGRLYYHLEKKFGYSSNEAKIHFFALKVGNDIKCINFPYMASVLSDLQHEHSKFKLSIFLSSVAIALSLISIGISAYDSVSNSDKAINNHVAQP